MTNELVQKLFAYKKEVAVNDDVLVYMRIPGDQVVEDARNAALLESRKLRRELRNPESDAYLLHIDAMEDLEDDDLIQACANLAVRDVMRDFVNANPKASLPELSDYPTQAEQEEYAAAKVERENEYLRSLQAYVEDWRKSYTSGLRKQNRDKLKNAFHKLKTDRVCEEKFSEMFEDLIIVEAIFADADCKQRAFTVAEFNNLPSVVKNRLRSEFSTLSISGEDIKKS